MVVDLTPCLYQYHHSVDLKSMDLKSNIIQ